MINSPCYECAERSLGCHADCEKYIAWAAQNTAPAINAAELETVRAENVRLKALTGVRSYGDSVRLETACKALAVKYSVKPVGRLYGAILGAWALLWYEVAQWAKYFKAWNRG